MPPSLHAAEQFRLFSDEEVVSLLPFALVGVGDEERVGVSNQTDTVGCFS